MKNYRLLTGFVICCGLGLVQSPSHAQRVLTAEQLDAIVKPDLNTCSSISQATSGRIESAKINPARVIPAKNRRAFPMGRISKTLNGVWRGTVVGDAGDVHVDYFWIIDTKANEALIIAQRSGKETVEAPAQPESAPKLTYLMCAHEGYSPGTSTPQIHEFVKVSSSTDNAAQIVEKATGVKSVLVRPSLSDLWRGLVSSGYFDSLPYVAYAGGFFKPIQLNLVQGTKDTAPQLSMRWDAEYRGGGSTKLKYTTGVPMTGSEQVQFVGATAKSGDYLVSSPGNGNLWKVEVVAGGEYDLAFDQVSLGPLE